MLFTFLSNVVILFILRNMSHYNFKKITVVPGGKVISLFKYVFVKICFTVCKKNSYRHVFIGMVLVL